MLKEYLSRIANSLRTALGTNEPINAQDFSDKITEVRNIAEKKPYLNTSNITNFAYYFSQGRRIEFIDYLDTSNGTDFEYMFQNCTSLTTIPQIATSSGTAFNYMFSYCT